jgi:hypothetical protein
VLTVLAVACTGVGAGQSVVQLRPAFSAAAPAPAREVPGEVKWGVYIGAVTGAAVAALIVFHGCGDGYDCGLRAAAGILPISLGAIVGIAVGGSIGKAIADDSEFRVGLWLALPR